MSFLQHSSIQRPLFVQKDVVNTLLRRPPYWIDLDRRFGTCQTIRSDPPERRVPLRGSAGSTGSIRPMERGPSLCLFRGWTSTNVHSFHSRNVRVFFFINFIHLGSASQCHRLVECLLCTERAFTLQQGLPWRSGLFLNIGSSPSREI